MSQVRKFAQGGGNPESSSNQTSTKHKPYKITIDGVVQELDDQDLANWASAYSTSTNSQQRIGLNDVINSIKRGNNVSYNSLKNTFTGVNWTNQDIIDDLNLNRTNPNQRQAERQKRRWARRDYRRGDARQQWMIGMQEAMRYNFNPIQSQQTEATSEDNRTALYGDTSWFDYNTDDKGNVTFSTGPENAGYLQRLKNFETFLNLSEDEADKQYSWDDENDRYIQDLRTAWASNQTSENPFTFSGLIERIRANRLNDTDLDWLRWMGFDKDSREDNTDPAQQTVVPRSWEGSGFNDELLKQNNYYVRKDNGGNTYLYTTNAQGELVPVQDSIYLKGTPWARGTQWEGGAIYGGRFYNQNDIYNRNSTVGQAIQSQLFNQLAGLTDPEQIRQAVLNSPWKVYGTENPFNISADNTFISGQSYLPGFTDIFNNGTYYWTDITNQYNAPEGTTILTYLNPNNRDRDNFLREQYAVYHNGQSQIFDSIEKLQNYLNRPDVGITRATQYNYGNPISQKSYIVNNGTRYFNLGPRYIIPGDENSRYNLYRDEIGNYYVDGNNGKFKLLQGKSILEKIRNGTVTAQEIRDGMVKDDVTFGKKNWYDWLFDSGVPQSSFNSYEPGSYDQFFGFYKKGGKIQKKQIGGMFALGNYGKQKVEDPIESKIGQPQKLNADKRLKTGTDDANIAAGVLDAAGMATSWIPGLGTAIGVLGSLARFSADVQKDGFQWKDVGNLGINLGLDALTLLPGVGAVGKAAKTGVKAAKTAKSAAQASKTLDKTAKFLNRSRPILSTAGVAAGTSQIAGAIKDANEGEFTSESMGNLLSGLGNTAAGITGLGRLYKTAKTIKKLNKPEIKDKWEVKPDDKKIKKAAKEAGNWVNKKSKQLNQSWPSTIRLMYSPKRVEETISKNWEQLLKSDKSFDQKLAAEFLNKFGPQTSKGIQYSGIASNSPWRYPKFEVKKDYVSLTKARDIRAGRGILKKMARENISSLQDVKKYIKTNLPPEKQEIWNKYLDKKGGEFVRLIKKLSKELDSHKRVQLIDSFKFQKGGIIKAQGGLKPGDLVYNNTNSNPYFDYEKAGILFNGSNVDWTKTYDKNGIFNAYRNYYIKHWNDASFNPYKQKYLQQLSQNNNNIDINNLSLDEFERITSDQNLGYAHNLYIDQALDDLVLSSMVPEGTLNAGLLPTVTKFGVDMSPYMNPTVEDEVIEEEIPTYISPDEKASEGQTGQEDGLNPSTYKPKVNTFDPQLLFGAAELARSIATNNYMFKKMKEANKLIQKEMPTEIYDRYQDHITPAYQNAAQQKRQFFVPTSTDALTNYAMRQTNEDQARQLELKGNLKASEQYSQWLQNDLAARRAYAQDRRETALFNRQEMLNKLLRDAQIDQGRIAANNQSIANFAMEGRNWFHQNRQRALDAISQYENAVAQNDYELGMRNAGKDFYDAYMALEDKSPYVDWMDYWQKTNPAHFQENQTRLFKDIQNARLHNRGLDIQWPYRIPTILAKKGGTLKYQQRHTGQKPDEAIWINRNKETAKALEKLHDAVIKLFMKSIS